MPRPSSEQLAAAYDDSYYGKRQDEFSGPVERFVEMARRMRARRLARGLSSGARVLDIGGGNGGFLGELGKIGNFELHGIEIAGESANRAAKNKKIKLKIGELEDTDYAPDSFDLVTLFHVFEHLTEPRKTLEIIHRILKPGGRLIMSFPNVSSMQARIFKANWFHLDPPRHLFLMPTTAFIKAMDEAGFSIMRSSHMSLEQNPYGFIQSCLNCFTARRDVLYERLKGNYAYAPAFGRTAFTFIVLCAAMLFIPAVVMDIVESGCRHGATVEYTLQKHNSRYE
jgi:SAM-dependent methyltransferase